ncbi:hypothetical protein [uncultured Shewanella sp.]|uniref:hypothetical protein n=1 Tax=uncultured Shewanella sp. TaxID=173975 RepID=UPI002625A045|nr:hypothetical protein [uncultured Shewanella sp.]
MQISSITQLTQLNLSQLDLDKNDTIELNGQKYNIRLNDQINVSKDYGQKNCFQKACQNISDFFERMTTQDQITCTPRANQIQTILQQKVANQVLNIANITTGTAFLSALEQYQGDLTLADAIDFKQAYRTIQLTQQNIQQQKAKEEGTDNLELFGIDLIALDFSQSLINERQYERLCELTQIAATHGELSGNLKLKNEVRLGQNDFINLQEIAADSRALQAAAKLHNREPLDLIKERNNIRELNELKHFNTSPIGKDILALSDELKLSNRKICDKLSIEAYHRSK